jgi:hypothetical protein
VSSILLDHHNKLGDNIIMNGLVREYAKTYDTVGIFCIPRYHTSVSFMYRDLTNLKIVMSKNQRDKDNYRLRYRFLPWTRRFDEIKVLYNDPEAGIPAERQFYGLAGVPHTKKWGSFYVERDLAREKSLFDKIVPSEPYIFIHDDNIYGGLMDDSRINPALPHVSVEKNLTDNIFDYCSVIERAAEIHVVDSVFMFLVDCLPYENSAQKLFVHRYARSNPPWRLPILKKNWTILE